MNSWDVRWPTGGTANCPSSSHRRKDSNQAGFVYPVILPSCQKASQFHFPASILLPKPIKVDVGSSPFQHLISKFGRNCAKQEWLCHRVSSHQVKWEREIKEESKLWFCDVAIQKSSISFFPLVCISNFAPTHATTECGKQHLQTLPHRGTYIRPMLPGHLHPSWNTHDLGASAACRSFCASNPAHFLDWN